MRADCKKIQNLHAEKIKSLLIKKKNLSNYYANICFLKSVWWARKLFDLAPNISAGLNLSTVKGEVIWRFRDFWA